MLLTKKSAVVTQSTLINKLMKCMVALISALEQENKLLENGELSNIEAVIEKKVTHLQDLSGAQQDVEQFTRSNTLDKTDPALVKLEGYFIKLDKLNHRNEVLLRSNIEVSNKLVEMYKANRVKNTIRKYGYNSQGNINSSKNLEKIMPAISLNNKV